MSQLSLIETSQQTTETALAGICVVIPAFNEEVLIGRCIQSVLDAGLEAGQIYVVDDHSSDDTALRVQAFTGVNLLRHDRNFGKLRGLQHAIDTFDLLGRYQFLALLDAD